MQNGGLDKESEDAICSGETGASRHANWTVKENLEAGLKWKEEGNRHMQGKDHASALKCYHKANLHLAGIIDQQSSMASYSRNVADPQSAIQANDLRFGVYMNMGQIYINQGKYSRGLQILAQAGKIKANAKLHYRQGICYTRLKDFDRAILQFDTVSQLDHTMRDEIDRLKQEIIALEKLEDKKAQRLFRKFFL